TSGARAGQSPTPRGGRPDRVRDPALPLPGARRSGAAITADRWAGDVLAGRSGADPAQQTVAQVVSIGDTDFAMSLGAMSGGRF
ncbi:MAG TPA: hypothetical protein VE152_04190, partial [Acidimicrobiales bacterium]|nr:hypothetical protein [Acidimicrobiales bacterium]